MADPFVTQKSNWVLSNGDPVTIIRSSGNVQTTARIMTMKRKTNFFSLNYLREAIFVPTSGVQRGDLVLNNSTNEQFFVEGYQVKTRNGIVSSINCELYAVNYSNVQVQRYQITVDNNGRRSSTAWNSVATLPMNIEHKSGNTPYKDGLLLAETVFLATLQTTTSINLNDRFLIDGKPYRADDINLSVIPGLQVVQLSVDTRQ